MITSLSGLLTGSLSAYAGGLVPFDVPVGWSDGSDAVNVVHALLLLAGVPLLLLIGIAIAIYAPPLMRGESVTPGAPAVEDQWLGGPRTSPAELTSRSGTTAPEEQPGGASGRW